MCFHYKFYILGYKLSDEDDEVNFFEDEDEIDNCKLQFITAVRPPLKHLWSNVLQKAIDNFYPPIIFTKTFLLFGRVPNKPLLPNQWSDYFLAGRGHAQNSWRGSDLRN